MPARALNDYLKRRREETIGTSKEIRQADIALALRVSQPLISKVERGLADLSSWEPSRLYDLLLAYGVPPAKMLEVTDMPEYHAFHAYLAERNAMYRVREGERVRFLGKVSAGKLGVSYAEDGAPRTVNVPDAIVARYRLEDVFAVNVDGESMIDRDARDSIPPGSLVYFHCRLQPDPGEIVCVYLAEHDHTVIKRWKPRVGYTILESSNPEHKPIIVQNDDEAVLQGVYLTHIPETPRLR